MKRNDSVLAILLLMVIGVFVYSGTLVNGFVWDDKYLVVDNQFIRSFSGIKSAFTHYLFYFSHLPVLHG